MKTPRPTPIQAHDRPMTASGPGTGGATRATASSPSGATPSVSTASTALRTILQEAARSFAWVIIDSPPLAAFADSLQLASAADGVLLVGREGITPEPELRHAVQALQGFPLLGMVLNGGAKESAGYYRGYAVPQLAAGRDALA